MSIENGMPKFPQAEESAMCVDVLTGGSWGKIASIREPCQNIYTPLAHIPLDWIRTFMLHLFIASSF